MTQMNLSNVLVTGGAGFIGSQLIKRLLPISDHIYVIDDLSTGNLAAVPTAKNLTFYHGSITDESLLANVLPQVEWVFHLACRNLALSVEDVVADYETNFYGTFQLLRMAKQHCPQLQRFIYTSTASVYGNAEIIPTPESYHKITMPYSASKFSAEHYCQVYYQLYRLPVTVLRLSNVYGPGQLSSNPYCGVIAKFFEFISQNQPLMIYGDGTQTRDFTFIEDAIEAILLASRHPQAIGQVYNVGTGKEVSVNQLAEQVMKTFGHATYPTVNRPKRIVDNVYRRAVDPRKLQAELSWQIHHSLEQGLQKTYQWLKGGGKP